MNADYSDSKSKRRGGYLLKKRVLRKADKSDKESSSNKRDSGVQQPVFGIPLSQCVELSSSAIAAAAAAHAAIRKPSTASEVLLGGDAENFFGGHQPHLRSESRTSMGSVAGIERVSFRH